MLTDDVKCEIVVPWQTVVPHATVTAMPPTLAFCAREALFTTIAELVPLLEERAEVVADVGLELEDVFLREDVGDDLALAGMLDARTRVEEAALNGHERVVESRLKRAGAVAVDDLQCVGVRDGQVVRRKAYKGACEYAYAKRCVSLGLFFTRVAGASERCRRRLRNGGGSCASIQSRQV